MTLSESLGQKCHPVSHAAPLKRNTPTPFSFLSLSPRQTGVMEKKKDGGASVCSSHPVCSSEARTSLYHLGGVKVLCLFFCKPRAIRIPSVPCRSSQNVICLFFLLRLQQARSRLCHVGCVKVLCLFFLPLGQARSHLCHVGSSHPVCSTHLTEKCGSLEKAQTSLCHVGRVKVLCLFFLSLEQARSRLCHVGCVKVLCLFFLYHWASKTASVPCRLSVFLPSC